ncbi:DUF92 domain-containing protein [Mycoplasmatota bacterium]|nr:DUF92 domain-containing protein [Mycoplasmatota bacterium]
MDIAYGFILSLLISAIAYKKKSLSLSGFICALIVGTLIYYMGTYVVFSILMMFFISSSLVTKFKEKLDDQKGRTYKQVLANASAALIFSLMYFLTKQTNIIYLVIACVAIAASNADTWASEIGKLSKNKTVSMVSFKPIEQDESGGISLQGIIASILGSIFIAIFSMILLIISNGYDLNIFIYGAIIAIAGFLGSIVDSYLGILIQEKYKQNSHDKIYEKVENRKNYILTSGIKYIDNDMVNLISTLFISTLVYILLIS